MGFLVFQFSIFSFSDFRVFGNFDLDFDRARREKLGVQLVMVPARTVEDYEAVFSTMSREQVGGFLAVTAPLFISHRTRLADLALKHRLPGMFGGKESVEAGGLMS